MNTFEMLLLLAGLLVGAAASVVLTHTIMLRRKLS